MVTGGSLRQAGTLLGLPWSAARHAVATVIRQLTKPKRRAAFDDAVEALTDHLHHAESRVDYGRRRDALATWSLNGDEWRDLTSGLVGKPVNRKGTSTSTGRTPSGSWPPSGSGPRSRKLSFTSRRCCALIHARRNRAAPCPFTSTSAGRF